ncbi:MAG: hypothetical protein AAGC88_10395, partial [Bacteroidota bacterium]
MRRPRRNRKSAVIRSMVEETRLSKNDFIYPLFLIEGKSKKIEVSSMPGIHRWSSDLLLGEIEECLSLGIKTFALFPAIDDQLKDKMATESLNHEGLYLSTIRKIKEKLPEACIMTDVAMDPYSSDGHDGIVQDGEILNDETLEVLGDMAVAQAEGKRAGGFQRHGQNCQRDHLCCKSEVFAFEKAYDTQREGRRERDNAK